jgi:hypothetical protein
MTTKLKILLIPEGQNGDFTPCGWIRLIHPYMQLAKSDDFQLHIGDWDQIIRYKPDVVVTQRMVGGEDAAKLFSKAQNAGAKVILDLDDYLLRLPGEHPDFNQYEHNRPILEHSIDSADLVTTSTNVLANKISANSMVVVPNELAPQLWFSGEDQSIDCEGSINFLFAGTISHGPDWKLIERQVVEWLNSNSICNLYVVGVTDKGLPKHSQIHRLVPPRAAIASYPAYVNWIRGQQRFHFGLAPLISNEFNSMKSDLKLLEYSALGAKTLASPVGPYQNTRVPSDNYVLVNDDQWLRALNAASSPVISPNLESQFKSAIELDFSLRNDGNNQRGIREALQKVLN